MTSGDKPSQAEGDDSAVDDNSQAEVQPSDDKPSQAEG